jgi:uncharacterized protein (TIRG00374 family)
MNILPKIKSILGKVIRNPWSFRAIGVSLFIMILMKINLHEAWYAIVHVDLTFVILSLVAQLIALLFAAIRWQYIMRRFSIRLPFTSTLVYQLIGTAAALVTPGQVGEFVKVFYHRREGYPAGESFLSVLIDRLCDIFTLVLFGFIAISVIFRVPIPLAIILGISGITGVTLVFLFLRNKEENGYKMAALLARITPKAYKEMARKNVLQLTRKISEFNTRFLFSVAILSLTNFFFQLLRSYMLVLALHIQVPFTYFAMVVPLLRLVGLLPISILGIGTRDITAIYLLGRVGVSQPSALLVSTLTLITVQFQTMAGLVAWWRNPLRFKKGERLTVESPIQEELI